MKKLHVYEREDGKWDWNVRARNGRITSTSGSQGYNNKQDAIDQAADQLKPEIFATLTIDSKA